ncbi:MAG: polynucleotide adenylyltransferase PcnB [Acidobacteriota bacterium]
MPPLVVPRDQHTLSRRHIDPDALKVLYRLKDARYAAYLVGGSVRDLLLDRRPKDFDIGTDAHPYQVKKLFRNCYVVGRRFRLAHVKFGAKVIEVATFRRQVSEEEAKEHVRGAGTTEPSGAGHKDHLIHRDNTFGTAEEDAFRRDFTINALFYDIATFSIIDYVGGLEDLRLRVVRCIGDPGVRFREDPVRMQRAITLAARMDLAIDPPVIEAIGRHRGELTRAAPARLADEYYKILRSGFAERAFRELKRVGLLEPLSHVLHEGVGDSVLASLSRLDAYRRRFEQVPDTLSNAILLGSLIAPLGFSPQGWPAWVGDGRQSGLSLGVLPLARREVERVHQVLVLQRRLLEPSRSGRARWMLTERAAFRDALTWLEIHGQAPEMVAYWMQQAAAPEDEVRPKRRRRRRRRPGRRREPSGEPTP